MVDSLLEVGRSAERAGLLAEARARYEEALRWLSAPADAPMAATLCRWIGDTYRGDGAGEAALDCYHLSLTLAELNGDARGIAHAYYSMGVLNWHWGQLDKAEQLFGRARTLAEESQESRLIALVDQNRGVLANMRGDLVQALRYFHRSLDRIRALGEDQSLGATLNGLGMVYTALGRWEEAETLFDECAEVCARIGDRCTRAMVEVSRAELHLRRGAYERARRSCDTAFAIARATEHRAVLGEVHKWYGILFREIKDYERAETHFRSAMEIAERFTIAWLAGEVQRELARLYRAQDRNREALQALHYAHRVFDQLRARLELEDVDRCRAELEDLYVQIVRLWGESIESKDRYTAGHCERVADYSCMLARALGFDKQTLSWFRMGAFLHDIGKTMVPADILNKKGELTSEEWEVMRRHTIAGVEILSRIEFPWDVRPMVRSHHEQWDGGGYPDGLSGRAIPLSARILCVADVFDALTTTRSYRPAHPPREALAIMERDAGRIFDPEIFALFKRLMEEHLDGQAGGAVAPRP